MRKVSPAGTITTVAGTGQRGETGDGGPATSARLYFPRGVAVDGQGNIYISDYALSTVRRVTPGGTITTFAGTRRKGGFSGDRGPATSAQLRYPEGIATDRDGNVYIADRGNGRVRKVTPGGTITTFAGGGSAIGDGGPATSASLSNPEGLAVDGQGSAYIADWGHYRVRKVSGGTITTVAGNGGPACGPFTIGPSIGDGGSATSAPVCQPWGVALDAQGNLYVSEQGRSRVRKVGTAASTTPAAPKVTLGAASPQTLTQQGITITARCDTACSLVATGSLTIAGTRSTFRLSRATAKLPVPGSRRLTLRCSAATQKRFRRLLKRGMRAQAVITVKATDTAGHSSTSKRTVVVR